MPRGLPQPSAAENDTLALHITGWETRTALQRAICLAVLRGYCYTRRIAEYLDRSQPEIESALLGLTGLSEGLLWDNHKLVLH